MSNYCPSSFSSTLDRTKSLGCNRTYQYHCMRNKEDGMVEKCLKISWIQEDDCAVYDTDAKTIDAWPCDITRGICPKEQYLSNEVMSYSACVPLSSPTNGTDEGNVHEINTNDIQFESDGEGTSSGIIIAIVCIFVVCIALGVAVFIHFRRKRRGHTNKDDENTASTEEIMMLNKEAGNREHLKRESETSTEEIMMLNKEAEIREHLKRESEKLEFFFEADECTFDSSIECKELDNQIKELSGVILIGKTGSGKTSLAWHLCKTYHGENINGKECEVIVAKNEELHDNITFSENKRTILLLDDFFETKWDRNSFIKGVPKIKDKFDHDLLLIMTMSDYSFEKMEKSHDCSAILEKCKVIEMEKTLTGFYVMKILEANDIVLDKSRPGDFLGQKQFVKALDVFNPEEASFSLWKKKTPELGFCLISRLAIRHKTFLNCFESFLQNPISQITKSVGDLHKSKIPDDKNKYCTLVYAAMHGGKIDKASMDLDLFNAIGEFHGIGSPSVNTDHYLLRNQRDGAAQFLHKCLFQILFVAFGRKHSAFFIQNCPLNILLKFSSFTKESNTQDLFYFRFSDKDNRKLLKERIEKREERIEVNISRDEILQELNSK